MVVLDPVLVEWDDDGGWVGGDEVLDLGVTRGTAPEFALGVVWVCVDEEVAVVFEEVGEGPGWLEHGG